MTMGDINIYNNVYNVTVRVSDGAGGVDRAAAMSCAAMSAT